MTTETSSGQGLGQQPAVLAELRNLTEPALQVVVGRLYPGVGRVESYHRGWTTADGQPSPRPGGKSLRPALALLSARAVSGPDRYGVTAGVAVELVHDFSLLHDDLMDGDVERRHRPTAWATFGAPAAILTGDALLALATEVVLESESSRTLDGIRLMHRCVAELITGQVLDLEFEQRQDVSLDDCVRMADGKTAALLECASSLGALLCGGRDDQVEALGKFGRELGLAFQLVDDALGIWGDTAVTGKPVLSDLRSRKKTLPITAALESRAKGLETLRELIAADAGTAVSEQMLEAAARQLSDAGFQQWAVDEANQHLESAVAHICDMDAIEAVKEDLIALARFSVARRF